MPRNETLDNHVRLWQGTLRTAIMDNVEWPMRQVFPVLAGYDKYDKR